MSEYTADELADNSNDEKRLEKAERTVKRKLAKRKKKSAKPGQVKQNAHFLPAQAATQAGTTPFQFHPRHLQVTVPQPECWGHVLLGARWATSGPVVQR